MESKKTLKAVPDKQFSTLLRLVFTEGGTVPDKYAGLYKSRAAAQVAIEAYEREQAEKKVYPRAPNTKEEAAKVRPKPKAAPKKKPEPERSVTEDGEASNES